MRSSTAVINGNKFEDKNGKLYLNGKEITNEVIQHERAIWPAFACGFICGAVFLALLVEFANKL